MPHIIVEYSDGLKIDIAGLLEDLHNSIDGLHNVAKARIKTRAHKIEDYVVGEDNGEFAHIELKLMPGRTDEMKTELSGILEKITKEHLSKVNPKAALTVEVTDLHGPSYRT